MTKTDFVLGPYVTRRGPASPVDEFVENTGCVLEFATMAEAHGLEIFQCSKYSFEKREFSSYAIREIEMPFGIECFQFQVKEFFGEPYITLTAFLSEMYSLYSGLTPIRRFFAEFAQELPFGGSSDSSFELSREALRSDIAASGYRVGSVMSYGRRLLVDFVWTTAAQRNSDELSAISTGAADFRPLPDKSLGLGKWLVPRSHFVESLLFAELRSLGNGAPANLFTERGRNEVLAKFEWSPLALMTEKEARQARIEFVRMNSELAKNTKQLAEALKTAKLYSDETSLSQIRKFLPSLVKATQIPG